MPKKILVCCNAYPPHFVGGAELIAHFHSLAMRQLGHEVRVFAGDATFSQPHYTMEQTTCDGLTVYRVHLRDDDFKTNYEHFYHPEVERHFAAVLDAFQPDVVHFHNLIGLSVGIIKQARRRGIRTVLTVHDHWGFCHKNTLIFTDGRICKDFSRCGECMAHVDGATNRQIPIGMRKDFFAEHLAEVDVAISPSRYLAETYIKAGFPREKMHVVVHGMDLEKMQRVYRVPQPGLCRFTFVGYMGEHKGVVVLADAIEKFRDDPRVLLQFVGRGHLEEPLRCRIKARGLEDRVKFWGRVPNEQIVDVLSQTDVLVLPSIWPENQPVTILEALTCGIPVIGSRLGGIPELVDDGVTGFLFQPGSGDDLAAKMAAMAASNEKREAMGEVARQRWQISYTQQVQKIIALYDTPTPAVMPAARFYCLGDRLAPAARDAVRMFCEGDLASRPRVLMREWVPDDGWTHAAALLVTDNTVRLDQVREALLAGVCLVVPYENEDLRDIVLDYRCGLVYRDAAELLANLRYLAAHIAERKALGVNGRRGLEIAGLVEKIVVRRAPWQRPAMRLIQQQPV